MSPFWRSLALAALSAAFGLGLATASGEQAPPSSKRVIVIPVSGEIAEPSLYILRRGLKEAEEERAEGVVLDVKTPGGGVETALEMMEAIRKYDGPTVAYVDNEAMSAGAYVSAVCSEIWFAPDGVIGAAAPVLSTGGDLDATMKLKLVSYLTARMRAISEGKGHRGEILSAMIDSDSELRIDGRLIKGKNQLLSLTAAEAMRLTGTPPRPLLGSGTARDEADLIARRFGPDCTVVRLEVTWSERLAVLLNKAAPELMGLGLLSLFIGFKAPGWGGFIIAGVGLLSVVFLGGQVAGLSGHEPVLFFGLGLVLLLLELIFFHSAGFLGIVGLALMLISLVLSMVDLWPGEALGEAWSADAFARPILNVAAAIVISGVLGAGLLRFLPSGWFWDRLVAVGISGGPVRARGGLAAGDGLQDDPLAGRTGVAVTALRPGGQVLVDGLRYEARAAGGAIDEGAAVVVRGRSDFELVVDKA